MRIRWRTSQYSNRYFNGCLWEVPSLPTQGKARLGCMVKGASLSARCFFRPFLPFGITGGGGVVTVSV